MSKQILYFDAQIFNQILVKRILQKEGHVASCANDRECAWQMALTSQPDLILIDMHLETAKGGIHFTRALRRIAALQTCPIILLTPPDDSAAEIEALSAGANGFIYKPASIRELQTAFRTLLNRAEPAPVRRPVGAPAYAYATLA
ncbi:MAG: response regulator transcription factor [Chloroflexi bacterium]|nr:response regulator transcription factor [Chloroflexota bacterium]MBP8055547.1 response regulator transcription factor [Chloroflexota bacterium]